MASNNPDLDKALLDWFTQPGDETELSQLETLLLSNEEARKQYLMLSHIDSGLINWSKGSNLTTPSGSAPLLDQDSSVPTTFSWTTPLISFLVVAAASLAFAWFWFGNSSDPSNQFAARMLYASNDAVLEDTASHDFLLRFKANEIVRLRQGHASFSIGPDATVRTLGNSAIRFNGEDSIEVIEGSVRVETGRTKLKISTPHASVDSRQSSIEIQAVRDGPTELLVDSGKAKITTFGSPSKSLVVKKGEQIQLGKQGVLRRPISEAALVKFPNKELGMSAEISLVDLIAGGDGTSRRVGAAIDANSGMRDLQLPPVEPESTAVTSNGRFNLGKDSPFVDGTFVYNKDFARHQVNSFGDEISASGTDGTVLAPIWSRRNVLIPDDQTELSDFWNRRLAQSPRDKLRNSNDGIVGIHPNVGITIDFEALRKHHGVNYNSITFQLDCTTNTAINENLEGKIYLWVLCDGLNYEKAFEIGTPSEMVQIDIPDTKFVTFAVAGTGRLGSLGNLLLVDPIIRVK